MKVSTLLVSAAILSGIYRFGFSERKKPAEDWGASYTRVLQRAQAENKPILLDFTGSDWCVWCMRMNQEVLNTPQFAAYAQQNLVLATVDFPKSLLLAPAGNAQNESLKKQYRAEMFPTFVLVNQDGRELGRLEGYLPGGPAAFIAKLNTFYTPVPAVVTYRRIDFQVTEQAALTPTPATSPRPGQRPSRF